MITALFVLMIVLLDLVAIVQVLTSNLAPAQRTAWMLAIVLLPIVGMVAFFLTVQPDAQQGTAA